MSTAIEVKEKPILFNAEMVRAILDGRKSQTRRVVKPQPVNEKPEVEWGWAWRKSPTTWFSGTTEDQVRRFGLPQHCPYGQPGDRLWVRETWGWRGSSWTMSDDYDVHFIQYRADEERRRIQRSYGDSHGLPRTRPQYEGEELWDYQDYLRRFWASWRPSIHMPRWASRLSLAVTALRVGPVREIRPPECAAG